MKRLHSTAWDHTAARRGEAVGGGGEGAHPRPWGGGRGGGGGGGQPQPLELVQGGGSSRQHQHRSQRTHRRPPQKVPPHRRPCPPQDPPTN